MPSPTAPAVPRTAASLPRWLPEPVFVVLVVLPRPEFPLELCKPCPAFVFVFVMLELLPNPEVPVELAKPDVWCPGMAFSRPFVIPPPGPLGTPSSDSRLFVIFELCRLWVALLDGRELFCPPSIPVLVVFLLLELSESTVGSNLLAKFELCGPLVVVVVEPSPLCWVLPSPEPLVVDVVVVVVLVFLEGSKTPVLLVTFGRPLVAVDPSPPVWLFPIPVPETVLDPSALC